MIGLIFDGACWESQKFEEERNITRGLKSYYILF
jgi:hypothetical protein